MMNGKNGFGVACCLERIARMLGTQITVVVDLAVENDHGTFYARHGLLT